ncbi:MAG: S1/P1 nuclease [Burkholderiaceae bacterium]
MTRRSFRAFVALLVALFTTAALPWGPDGHHTVGALADRLIVGTNAEAQVKALLGGLTLEQAAVWADCAKGVDPSKNFAYTPSVKFPECVLYETPQGEAEMIDFVKRNDTNCPHVTGDASCHTQYHYSDEAIQRKGYHLGDVGTRDFDVVAAISATIHVLKGDPAPPPFDIKDKREALLLLSHYVGDIAQPLHVGAVYLDANGKVIDPSVGTFDPATATQGGNQIQTIRVATNHPSEKLHATWDDTPEALHSNHIDAAWVARARAQAKTPGNIYGWSAQWAGTTMTQARVAFKGLQFGPQQGTLWMVPLTGRYDDSMAPIKKRQLTLGGARLAQTLTAIWP